MSKSAFHLLLRNQRLRYILVVVFLKLIDIGLSLFGYRRVCRWLLFFSPEPNPSLIRVLPALSTARFVNQVATRSLRKKSCLRRSLLLWWLLRWQGIPSAIRIGVNLGGGHAWVEHHGQVINDRSDVAATYPIVYGQLSPEGEFTLR